jgi:hypothetical protein
VPFPASMIQNMPMDGTIWLTRPQWISRPPAAGYGGL